MSEIELKPASVFQYFAQINQVPRPSKHEEKIIQFLLDFGKSLGLETRRDETGNVIICKPAYPGLEGRPTVVLQSHMDMVCEKNADVQIDFMNDPIQTYIEGEWMHAKGTTLGADDGIGIAMEMAILADKELKLGPIECVFTRDEETGLTGAFGMKDDFMSGKYLINLDSEDEGQIFIACAGGCRTNITFHYTDEAPAKDAFFASLQIKGLVGGHSGDDINKKRANANKLLVRFLYTEMKKMGLQLVDIQAGGLDNAIPREACAIVAVPFAQKEELRVDWNLFAADVENEYCVTEKTMEFVLGSVEPQQSLIDRSTSDRLIRACQAVDNGVFADCQDIQLVETSSNLASIRKNAEKKEIRITSSQRSSIGSAKQNMVNTVTAVFELAGADNIETCANYPGWKMDTNSNLLKVTVEQYKKLFGKDPLVIGIHAGLECGLFSEKYPHMDMVSFGPTLRGVHSPDEKLEIRTVQMVWDHLLAILENIK